MLSKKEPDIEDGKRESTLVLSSDSIWGRRFWNPCITCHAESCRVRREAAVSLLLPYLPSYLQWKMGNNQSSAIVSRTGGALDTFVSELGSDIIYDKRSVELAVMKDHRLLVSVWSLGTSRFLKTVRCRHRNGFIVAKIYVKPDTSQLDEKYLRRLKSVFHTLRPRSHTITLILFRGKESPTGCTERLYVSGLHRIGQSWLSCQTVGCKQFVWSDQVWTYVIPYKYTFKLMFSKYSTISYYHREEVDIISNTDWSARCAKEESLARRCKVGERSCYVLELGLYHRFFIV